MAETYYQKNRDKYLAKAKAYRATRPEYTLWQSCKHRAKAQGLEFSISINDIVIPEVCPVLGIPMKFGKPVTTSPSVDRVDNTKGYIPGNICVISTLANRMKGDLTPELCLKFYNYMVEKS